MRSKAVSNITAARSLSLLKGAALWRAYTNAPDDNSGKQQRAHRAWRKWLDAFMVKEGLDERRVYEAVSRLCSDAYSESLQLSAHSRSV